MARVLLVGKGPPDRGGIAAYLDGLLTGPAVGAHSLQLLNLTNDDVPRGGRFTAANIRRTLRDASALWRAARQADIVHIHSALVPLSTLLRAGVLALVARVRGKPVIVHAHSGKVQRWLKTPQRDRAVRLALIAASRVVAVSEGGRAVLERALGSRRVALIDNGVDLDHFAPDRAHTPPDVPQVLFAGVLTERKGLLDLFEASALIMARGVHHSLVVAGGMPDEGPEAQAAVHAAVPPHAELAGPQPHDAMPDLYRSADVFCLPSWWEAMPMSVLEASACGIPVVATHVGDVARAVIDGVTGFVVPVHDVPALAGALEQLLRDPTRRTAFGAAAREHVAHRFNASSTRDRLATLYGALTS